MGKNIDTILKIENISVSYDSFFALNNITLSLSKCEIVSILGPNGAGKSTLLNAICGLIPVRHGNIFYNGVRINGNRTYSLVKSGICLVPEKRHIFLSMTVLDNMEIVSYLQKDRKDISVSIAEVFNLFPILEESKNKKAGTLSVGTQQILAIGRSLLLNPKLLILDEPSFGLSPNYIRIIFNNLNNLCNNGMAILVVEQNAKVALKYSHRGYILNNGKIMHEGASDFLLNDIDVNKLLFGINN